MFFDSFQVASRYVWRAGIDEFTINLVGEKVQIVFLYQVTYAVHLIACVKVAGRVIRVAYKDTPGAFIYKLLEAFHWWQCKRVING